MLRIMKHLNKQLIPIIIIVVLLAFQAVCDLALPQYTSAIVNIGIQQSGTENAVPTAVRASTMNNLKLIMANDEVEFVDKNYTLFDNNKKDAPNFEKTLKQYPALEKEPVYVLNKDLSDKTVSKLEDAFAPSFISLTTLSSKEMPAEDAKDWNMLLDQFTAGLSAEKKAEIVKMPPIEILKQLPDNARVNLVSVVKEKVKQLPKSIVDQMAIPAVNEEYKAIGINVDSMQMKYILESGVIMILITLCSMTAVILVTMFASRCGARLGETLRNKTYKKVLSFSGKEMNKFSVASLITRCTNDIQQVQVMMIFLLRFIFYAPIIAIGGVLKVATTCPQLLWVTALSVGGVFLLAAIMFFFAQPKFEVIQTLIDKINLVLRESLTGLPVIRAFASQKHEVQRFEKENEKLTSINLFVNRLMSCMFPALFLIMNVTSILVVWVGAHDVNTGSIQVGDIMAVMQYSIQIIMSFLIIALMAVLLPRAGVSARRIEKVLNTKISVRDPMYPAPFEKDKKGVVEFDHVTFKYPGAEGDVLHNISFTANPGETTAIIGSTGCGKSTLINLIPRFYDATEGRILVDGVSVKSVTQKDLRAKIGYVPQQGILFSGTIKENIGYGTDNLLTEEAKKFAEVAQAEEFISRLPDQYETEVAQGGTNVSGGQRQRLSIARAIAVNPDIYIFDDSFSALDFKTDKTLRKELKEHTKDATVIIVAQRISTILSAEKILVLDKGKLVGQGTHDELMKSCEIYQEIAGSQLSKEELDNV